MKVKIKKKEETKEYNVINSWSDVTLEKWIKLVDLQNGTNSDEALGSIKELSDIPEKLIKNLSIANVAMILKHLSNLQADANTNLQRKIEIEGIRYGFHPDLSEITLGEYADIETFLKNGIDKHLPEVMAILYRPILEEKNDVYTIQAYDGKLSMRAEAMKRMKTEDVQSSLVFFWTFVMEFLKILPLSLKDQATQMMEEL
jgi:hypothetical protein|tara:strand:- start:737 stop:1339 length:603 start_codon:yes stop_codon:yes gene_type:complete